MVVKKMLSLGGPTLKKNNVMHEMFGISKQCLLFPEQWLGDTTLESRAFKAFSPFKM